jgi:lysophospholipase L1-like esterase
MIASGDRYVALGSSFAAGPGLRPRAAHSPLRSGRSDSNYAHRLAALRGLDLVDVTYSGATVKGILEADGPRHRWQLNAVTPDTALVTVTAGGNDVGYLPGLTLSSLPAPLRMLPRTRRRTSALLDPLAIEGRLAALEGDFATLVRRIRRRAPQAEIVLIDYLTILPPLAEVPDREMLPLPADVASWGRDIAARLTAITRAVARAEGATFIAASEHSHAHHAWADDPWTRRFHLGLRGGAPFHPTLAGMRAVADLLSETLDRAAQ